MELKSNYFRAGSQVYRVWEQDDKIHCSVWGEISDSVYSYNKAVFKGYFIGGNWRWCDATGRPSVTDCTQPATVQKTSSEGEHTGGSVNYYKVQIDNPTTASEPYQAECNDIIEALGMNYAEGNAFKSIWRRCAARTLGKKKKGNNTLYDAEKTVFFAERILEQEKQNAKLSGEAS